MSAEPDGVIRGAEYPWEMFAQAIPCDDVDFVLSCLTKMRNSGYRFQCLGPRLITLLGEMLGQMHDCCYIPAEGRLTVSNHRLPRRLSTSRIRPDQVCNRSTRVRCIASRQKVASTGRRIPPGQLCNRSSRDHYIVSRLGVASSGGEHFRLLELHQSKDTDLHGLTIACGAQHCLETRWRISSAQALHIELLAELLIHLQVASLHTGMAGDVNSREVAST
jgi:hypothetical protein